MKKIWRGDSGDTGRRRVGIAGLRHVSFYSGSVIYLVETYLTALTPGCG